MANVLSIEEFAPRAHRKLTAFGYKVTLEFVTEEAQRLASGQKPRSVIGMMMAAMLEQTEATLTSTG